MRVKAIGTMTKGGKTLSLLREIKHLDGGVLLINDEESGLSLFERMVDNEIRTDEVLIAKTLENPPTSAFKDGSIKHILWDNMKLRNSDLAEWISELSYYGVVSLTYSFQLSTHGTIKDNH